MMRLFILPRSWCYHPELVEGYQVLVERHLELRKWTSRMESNGALSLSKGNIRLKIVAYFVYILKCCDRSYYIGVTSDLKKRLKTHNTGKGADWTARRLPVELIYEEQHDTKSKALKREKQLKGWSRTKKEALINGELELLRKLSKSPSKE